MTYSQAGQLPHHQYCWVDLSFISNQTGFKPCVWFGLVSIPGRAWGCTIMLECGAVYRAVPPYALAFHDHPEPDWRIEHAQRWDCYGREFTTIEYTYLRGVSVEAGLASAEAAGGRSDSSPRFFCLASACPKGMGPTFYPFPCDRRASHSASH